MGWRTQRSCSSFAIEAIDISPRVYFLADRPMQSCGAGRLRCCAHLTTKRSALAVLVCTISGLAAGPQLANEAAGPARDAFLSACGEFAHAQKSTTAHPGRRSPASQTEA